MIGEFVGGTVGNLEPPMTIDDSSCSQLMPEKKNINLLQVQAAAGRLPQKYPECNQGDLEHEYQVQSLIGRFDGIQS